MTDNPWFEEKAHQIDTTSVVAFGIMLTTRHGKARELVELLAFAEATARANLNTLVKAAFYDSNSDCCTFELRGDIDQFSNQAETIRRAARQTISQFEWYGVVDHGRGVQYGPRLPD